MSKRILVVDDDPDIRSSVSFSLEGSYEVDAAENGAVALDRLARGRYDAIVLDLMMPVVSGESLLAELAARGIRVPVIVVSAALNGARVARELGAAAYLPKPFDLDDLESQLRRLADGAA